MFTHRWWRRWDHGGGGDGNRQRDAARKMGELGMPVVEGRRKGENKGQK